MSCPLNSEQDLRLGHLDWVAWSEQVTDAVTTASLENHIA